MLIHAISTQPPTITTQPANRDGLILSSPSYIRSGTLPIESYNPPALPPDRFQLVDSNIAQQATDFLQTATGTPQELESQFLASVLGQHLQPSKTLKTKAKKTQKPWQYSKRAVKK